MFLNMFFAYIKYVQQVTQTASTVTPSPLSKVQSGHAAAMLQQLIAEADNKSVVFSDDLSAQMMKDQQLQGLQACQNDDVVHNNWLSKYHTCL